ncbi:MAG: CHAT domain-containing protein [Saccharothrix sp.]|nr:CHAT domain-containing protein [Saccharothrix sp.]
MHKQAYRAASAGRPADAVTLLRRALRALPAPSPSSSPTVEATTLRVRILITLSYGEAETDSVEEGLARLREAADLVAGLPEGPDAVGLRAIAQDQRALILHRAGRTAEALDLYDESVRGLEAGWASGAVGAATLATALMNRGVTGIAFGLPEAAERDVRRAIDLAEAEDLPLLKAKALGNLGDIAHLTGDVPRALAYHEQAERVFRLLAPDLVPRTAIDRARVMLAAGLADEAAGHLDEALVVLRRRRVGQDLAEAELTRAAAALLQSDLTTARTLSSQAQRRFRRRGSKSWAELAALMRLRADFAASTAPVATTGAALDVTPGIPSAVASAGASAGGSVISAGQIGVRFTPARATRLAERLTAVGLTDEAAVARLLAVRMAIRRGDTATARALVTRVPAPGPITPIDHRMLLRLCRAELAVAVGEPRLALREAEEGLAELGRVRDRMGGLDLLCGTAVHGRELGELAVGLVLEHDGDAEAAFDWLERTRAQVYRYEPLPAIDDPVLARRVAESRSLSRAVQQARLDGRPVAELEARLDALQREVARLGWHTSVWGRPRPVRGVTEVRTALGDRTMVSFVTHSNTLSAVVLTEGEAKLVRLGRTADAFELVRQLHADVDALAPDHLSPASAAVVRASAARRAERLDDALIGPLAGLVGEGELVVVPTGELYAVPWNALPTLHGRPIVVTPSATAWLNAVTARPSATKVVLVGGPDLPAVVGEVNDLRATYPDAVVAEAVADVLAELDGARLAHIAAHGEHVAENALFSRLELADGPLFAHEATRLRAAPEQVVLAACSLALSHIRPGDEALGFAGALLAGGSRTVVAAVNQVGDMAAARTMATFHELAAAGNPVSHALAKATAEDPLRRPFVCFGA